MSLRTFARLNALVGLLGIVMLFVSYNINTVPLQDHPTHAQLAAFGPAFHMQIMMAAWLQAVGMVLCVAFAVALVHLAGATAHFSGWLTVYGGVLLTVTSLVEASLYFSAATGAQPTTRLVSLDLIHATHRLYFVVAAPALLVPLGFVILAGRILHRAFGYAALALATLFAALGIADLFTQLPIADDVMRSLLVLWWFVAAVALLVRSGTLSAQAIAQEPERILA
jgi:hypothetical protein